MLFKQVSAVDRVPPPRNLFLRYNYMIATHMAFDLTMYFLIGLNMIPIAFELNAKNDSVWYMGILKIVNYVYCAIYILEAMIKVFIFIDRFFLDFFAWNQLFR